MKNLREQLGLLLEKGWTYAAIADEVGVRWDTARTWHLGLNQPRAAQAIMMMLKALEDRTPPPKRRYRPDAPQRRSKKVLVGTSPTR